MTPWAVPVTKAKTDDGFWELLPSCGITVGGELEIDLDSRRVETRMRGDREWTGEVCNCIHYIAPGGKPYVFPCELLDL